MPNADGRCPRSASQLDHIYRTSLDAAPPDTEALGWFMERLPPYLTSSHYPEHMEVKAKERIARMAELQNSGSAAAVTMVPSTRTLLAKLWHQAPHTPLGSLPPVHLDPHLSRSRWKREHSSRSGTPAYDNYYLELWQVSQGG